MTPTLPTFVVIGAMKAGTTTLHEQLGRHPDVFMSTTKELHFFIDGENWARGPEWYAAQFRAGAAATARGEVSPSYSQADIFPGVPARMTSLLPDIRVVYVVRHPIERMRSMYLHQLANGRESRPIIDAFREEEYYLNASRYNWQLGRYRELIPDERIKLLTTEQLATDPAAALAAVFTFLSVDPSAWTSGEVYRGRTDDKRIATSTRRRLAALPGYERLVRYTPDALRRPARRAATRPIDRSAADLPADYESDLIEQLRPDIELLRHWLGDDFDGWGLLD